MVLRFLTRIADRLSTGAGDRALEGTTRRESQGLARRLGRVRSAERARPVTRMSIPTMCFPNAGRRAANSRLAAWAIRLSPESVCVRKRRASRSRLPEVLPGQRLQHGRQEHVPARHRRSTLFSASAGAPVRAFHARLSCFAVCASFSVVDSLLEGKSRFMAEVDRLRETLRAATSGPKPVCLRSMRF